MLDLITKEVKSTYFQAVAGVAKTRHKALQCLLSGVWLLAEHLGSSHSGWHTAEWALLDQTHTALLAQSNLLPMGHTTSGLLSPWSSVEYGHRKLLKSSLLPSVLEPQTLLCFPCKKWALFLNVQLVYAVTLFLTQEPSTNTSHSLLSTHFSYSHESISIAWQLFTTKHNVCLKA